MNEFANALPSTGPNNFTRVQFDSDLPSSILVLELRKIDTGRRSQRGTIAHFAVMHTAVDDIVHYLPPTRGAASVCAEGEAH